MNIRLQTFLWVLPFFAFIFGYYALSTFFHTTTIAAPSLIGINVADALKVAATARLTLKLLDQKEDPDLPEGIIVSQTPAAGKNLKPHQSIYIVVCVKPRALCAPDLLGKSKDALQELLGQKNIKVRFFYFESQYPKNTTLAQTPMPGSPLERQEMTLYVSSGTTPLRIFPDLRGREVTVVREFLNEYDLEPVVIHQQLVEPDHCCTCRVVDQRPFAGTLFDLSKPAAVQLSVTKKA